MREYDARFARAFIFVTDRYRMLRGRFKEVLFVHWEEILRRNSVALCFLRSTIIVIVIVGKCMRDLRRKV